MSVISTNRTTLLLTSIAAACTLAACGGSNNSSPSTSANATPTSTFAGVVASSGVTPGSTTGNPTLKAGYFTGATVCLDANGNGVCDASEVKTTTDANGHFSLQSSGTGQLIADISTKATNTATGAAVPSHMIL